MAAISRTHAKRVKTSKTSISNLPRDVLINIFCNLPTKSILSCKHVCKEWHVTISDPHFAEIHYNISSHLSLVSYKHLFSPDQDNQLVLIEGYATRRRVQYKLHSSRIDVGFVTNHRNFEVINSCRGFLLLRTTRTYYDPYLSWTYTETGTGTENSNSTKFSGFNLHIYNPLTNEHMKLPKVMEYLYDNTEITRVGLGFSPRTKQYKVIRIIPRRNNERNDFRVHTIGTQVWRRVEIKKGLEGILDNMIWGKSNSLALNGALHWLVTPQMLACFDVDKEELGVMASPCVEDSRKYLVSVGMVLGMLCCGITVIDNSRDGVEMWLMREYGVKESWTKYVVLKDLNVSRSLRGRAKEEVYYQPILVEVRDNGEIVLLPQYEECRLITYDQMKEWSKRVRVTGIDHRMRVELFVPSFFSIGEFSCRRD